jgi:hypothetical protein
MTSRLQKLAISVAVLILGGMLGVATAFAGGKSVILTGEIGDAMCGNKHQMEGSAADCTRACISHGSKYALVVGDKVYTLDTTDKATLDKLYNLAGQKAKVSGTADESSIQVSSVVASK